MQLLKNIATGRDNQTYEITRVLTVVMFFFFIGLSVYDTAAKKEFNYVQFIAGGVTIIGTVAGALRVKEGLNNPAQEIDK